MQLKQLLSDARQCTVCREHLPLGCNPLLQGSSTSLILIIGQAPGVVAHTSSVPWDDRSGDRLRNWLGMSKEQFYDDNITALMPMGFCYPGTGKRGDLPPRPECAPQWHEDLLAAFTGVQLTIITGKYAFDRYLADTYKTITAASQAYENLLPARMALPHPSPRNNFWLKKNPWFEAAALPRLRRRVGEVLGSVK